MPYCPKCDMEFIDGITTCSDCGGVLVASKEVADAMKNQEQEEAMARRQAEYEAMQAEMEAMQTDTDAALSGSGDGEEGDMANETKAALAAQMERQTRSRSRVYVKKSQQYEDLKSSASAFILVGGILLVFSILCWANVVKLPLAGTSRIISQTVMTVLGLASLVVAVHSARSAKAVSGQIADEEKVTRQLIDWFTGSYTGEQLDAQILAESGELVPEELSLKRFELIQDILITSHDISDQAYVDLIAEDIYGKLYQD